MYYKIPVDDMGLEFDIVMNPKTDDCRPSEIGRIIAGLTLKLMPRFEGIGWVPLFAAVVTEVDLQGGQTRGWEVRINKIGWAMNGTTGMVNVA